MSTFYILVFELFAVAVVFRARFGGPSVENAPSRETPDEWYERQGSDPEYGPYIYEFRNVNEAFFLCAFAGVFTDNITVRVGHMTRISMVFMVIFVVHVILTNLTLLNILVGVVCECISEVSRTTKDNLKIKTVRHVLLEHLDEVDVDKNQTISPQEYLDFMMTPEVTEVLEDECGLDKMALAIIGEHGCLLVREVAKPTFGRLILGCIEGDFTITYWYSFCSIFRDLQSRSSYRAKLR